MAHTVVGLDLGSHSVKAVIVRMGLRGSEVVGFDTEPVPPVETGRSIDQAVFEAAGRLLKRLGPLAETVHCAVAGESAYLETVVLPAGASRRLEQVLRFELDEALPYDIDDGVFDYVELGRSSDEVRLLAVVVPLRRARELIESLNGQGIDPREIGVAPLVYQVGTGDQSAAGEVIAVIDLGHRRTNVAVLGDDVRTIRTILRGGLDLTERLAEVGRVSVAEAETYKLRDGLSGKVGEVLREGLRPLVREIRQTLKSHLASGGRHVSQIHICGGGALLKGLEAHLADEIGAPVSRIGAPIDGVLKTRDSGQSAEEAMLAYGLARREELPRAKRINLRRGELQFKGDYAFLKRRVVWASICLLGVLVAWIFSNYAEYSVLSDQVEQQSLKIDAVTTALFKKPVRDIEEVKRLLGGEQAADAPVPEKDAFDVVVELSRRIPESVVHDVETLEIKPKRVTIKGIFDAKLKTDTPPVTEIDNPVPDVDAGIEDMEINPADLIRQKLSEFEDCFTAIRIGKVQAVGERRRYQMDIESKCP